MLRSFFSYGSRLAVPFTSTSNHVHTSAVLQASHRKQQARSARKINIARREERKRVQGANRPHVVLGTRPGDHTSWARCDLAKVLIDEDVLLASTEPVPITQPSGTVLLPKYIGHGVDDAEKKLLFQNLPALSVEADAFRERPMGGSQAWTMAKHLETEKQELAKANSFARLLDLRNANARGIAYENRMRIVAQFSEPDNQFDTGRPEVQAALLTYKIRNLWSHLTTYKRDIVSRRSLRKLIHQRAKVLRYLRRTDRDRYETVLSRLALEPESVEGELVV